MLCVQVAGAYFTDEEVVLTRNKAGDNLTIKPFGHRQEAVCERWLGRMFPMMEDAPETAGSRCLRFTSRWVDHLATFLNQPLTPLAEYFGT